MPPNETKSCKRTAVDAAQSIHGTTGQLISSKWGAILLVASAYAFGGGGMLAWLSFLVIGPWFFWDVGLPVTGRLTVDALLCLLFFIQHSLMVRRRFRIWLTRSVRADFHGALYASASGCCLLLMTLLWQPVELALWSPPTWVRGAMGMVILVALSVGWWGSRSLGEFDALGIKPALKAFGDQKPAGPIRFAVRGPYRWVRHPLYLVSLIIIWAGPVFTVDRLLHNLLWTIWIVIGATMEERDLVDCFGDAYRKYQQAVPMLIPASLKPKMPDRRSRLHD